MNDLFWLTLVLLAVAALLRSELFFYLLYVIVGLQVVARLWLRRSAGRITWQRHAPAALFLGEQATVEIEVRNSGLLPLPWVSLYESIPATLHTPPAVREVVSLGAGERRVLRYTLQGTRRGYYQLGPLRMRMGDVLGLGEQALESESRTGVTVYPPVLPLAQLGLPASLPFGVLSANQSLFVDPARPVGVRAYQPGDSMRSIDWKNSARAGGSGGTGVATLLVRRYQPAIALQTLIALAFNMDAYSVRFAYDAMERSLVAASSLAAALEAQRQPVGLCTNGRDPLTGLTETTLPIASGRAHLLEILGVLGRLEPVPSGDVSALVWNLGAHLGWGSTIVVVAGGSAELISAMLPLKRRGFNLALMLADATPDLLGLARRHGIAAYDISRDGRPT